jgi:BirA family biotin operon repressor/biotin-[acetyl-CoA-carboxylase] ligase
VSGVETQSPPEAWPDALEAALAGCAILRRVHMIRETNSTQDAARRMGARHGDVIVAWNQIAGRGRLGRAWESGLEGIAVTFAVAAERGVRLTIAGAVAAAGAAEQFLGRPVGIKWPNDIEVDGRKLAGVLVEQDERIALPAIGMNVRQEAWPAALQGRAISLAQLGARADRVDVARALIERMDAALAMSDEALVDAFMQRDVLTGATLTVRQGGREIEGVLARLDPLRGLALRMADGREVWLDSATATLVNGPAAP